MNNFNHWSLFLLRYYESANNLTNEQKTRTKNSYLLYKTNKYVRSLRAYISSG